MISLPFIPDVAAAAVGLHLAIAALFLCTNKCTQRFCRHRILRFSLLTLSVIVESVLIVAFVG